MISLPETTPGFTLVPPKSIPIATFVLHPEDGSPTLRLAIIRKPSSVRFG